jgi:predicted RNA-binding protein with TRAM domain
MERILPENYKKVKKSIPVSIGNIHKVKIIDRSEKGDGIAKIKNFIIFVPNVDIGDLVKIKIVQVMRNCASGIKVKNTDKTFLLTKGPLIPTSFTRDPEGGLISISPWSSSQKYNTTSRHGTRCGKCKECGGFLKWDSKHNSSFCEDCGLEEVRGL